MIEHNNVKAVDIIAWLSRVDLIGTEEWSENYPSTENTEFRICFRKSFSILERS